MSKNILGQTFGNVSLDLTTSNITADKLTGTSEINGTYLTANRGVKTDTNKKLVSTTATANEIEFLQGVSSNIQDQLNAKQATIDSSNRINANLINDGSVSNAEFNTLDGIDTSQTIKTQLDLKLSQAAATIVYFTNAAAQGKQATIDSSNRLNANVIGSNGNVSNTEYGHLATVSSNIQDQLDAKQPEITSSARLDMTLCGAGNVDNQDLAQLTLASDLPDTIKNILTTPSTKLILGGTGLSYNTSTTPPTLNAEVSTSSLNTSLATKQDTLNLTDILFNSRVSQFYPTRLTDVATKAAFDGAIMCESIINYTQNGANPSFITFGTRFTNENSKITLGTSGNSRLFIDTNGSVIIGGDDTNTTIPTDSTNVYCLGITNENINQNANGLFVRSQRNRRVLRMDYLNSSGTSRPLEIITPSSSTNDEDDFILQTNNSLTMKVDSAQVFKCGPSNAQFTVNNLNNISDDRIKSNETAITNALDTMMKLKPYTYDKYNDFSKSNTPFKESGLISQDIWYNAPELRHLISLGNYYEADESGNEVNMNLIPTDIDNHEELNDEDFNPTNGWSDQEPSSVKYLGLIAYLIKAVQELKVEIDTLKNI